MLNVRLVVESLSYDVKQDGLQRSQPVLPTK